MAAIVLIVVDGIEKETENKKAFESFKEQQSSKAAKIASATPTERDGIIIIIINHVACIVV